MCHRRRPADDPLIEREVLRLDDALLRAARGLGAFDLAVGLVLARLFDRDLVGQLQYSRESDYIRERLGISPSLGFSWVRLARELGHRPLLRQAVTAGLVTPRKALAVLPLAVGDHEGHWTEAAMRLSLREIAGAVKAAGRESPEDRFEAEMMVLPMTADQQARLDVALTLVREREGPELKQWQGIELICWEYLSSFAEFDRGGSGGPVPEAAPPMPSRAARVVARHLAGVDEALAVISGILDESAGDDALALDACARRLLLARRAHDEAFGILAARAHGCRLHETLRYGSFAEYCEERLGMRAGVVRQRIWLERRMRELPALRAALSSGRLPFSKAVAVARHATPSDVDARIAHAQGTTVQQLEREGREEVERRNRGACIRELWSPCDAAASVRDAIAAAQAKTLLETGVAIDAGEALALVADHFVKFCEKHTPEDRRRRRIPQLRRRVLHRKAGLCAVPGCSRAAVHVHHIVFRSRGGDDTLENGLGLCAFHHLRGIHAGFLEVTGRAGERLHWTFRTGEAVPEEWITYGDDDVRRRDFAAAYAAARPPGDGNVEQAPGDGNVEPGSVAEGLGDGGASRSGDGPPAAPGKEVNEAV